MFCLNKIRQSVLVFILSNFFVKIMKLKSKYGIIIIKYKKGNKKLCKK